MTHTIGLISDLHGKQKRWFDIHQKIDPQLMQKFLQCDFILFAGDMSSAGTKSEVKKFLKWFRDLPSVAHKIVIAGNHDLFFDTLSEDHYGKNYPKSEVQKLLNQFPDIYYLEDSSVEIEGLKIWGSPWSLPHRHWAFMANEFMMKNICEKIPNDIHIMITHGPAFGKLDMSNQRQRSIDGKVTFGSEVLRETIDRIKPLMHVCGHIHSNYGMWPTVNVPTDTVYFNASCLDDDYEPTNPPIIFEIEI